jgi:hypothetical protein
MADPDPIIISLSPLSPCGRGLRRGVVYWKLTLILPSPLKGEAFSRQGRRKEEEAGED